MKKAQSTGTWIKDDVPVAEDMAAALSDDIKEVKNRYGRERISKECYDRNSK